jgi:phosphoadenosine phosphosulfate reductase
MWPKLLRNTGWGKMLKERGLFQDFDKVKDSITLIQDLEPKEGYYLAFSGGKDSVVLKHLADMAGVKYDAHYSVTTIDPPELVRFMRKNYPDVAWERPEKPFLRRLPEKGFPQRHRRWCCEEYKERGGSGRRVLTGIRAAESSKRAGRKAVETCYKDTSKQYINPIIAWDDDDVWTFIHGERIPYCSLYDEGKKRLGCLFCPMAYRRTRDVRRYPRMAKAFIKSFEMLYAWRSKEKAESVKRWSSGEDMFWWWIGENRKADDPDQSVLFE